MVQYCQKYVPLIECHRRKVEGLSISPEEFKIMVDELLYRETVSFEMMTVIAEKILKSRVRAWCNSDDMLRGRGFEDDIMQEIKIRLMKKTISRFLLKNGINGPVNMDCEGYVKWVQVVGENVKRNFAKKVRIRDFVIDNIDDPKLEKVLVSDDWESDAEKAELLRQSFDIVMASDSKIYMILTWMVHTIFIYRLNISAIESEDMTIKLFKNKTLFEMYDMILKLSESVQWMNISKAQKDRIMQELNKTSASGVLFGNMKYCDVFMTDKGVPSGKKSISNWMNRLNDKIHKVTGINYKTKRVKKGEEQG